MNLYQNFELVQPFHSDEQAIYDKTNNLIAIARTTDNATRICNIMNSFFLKKNSFKEFIKASYYLYDALIKNPRLMTSYKDTQVQLAFDDFSSVLMQLLYSIPQNSIKQA